MSQLLVVSTTFPQYPGDPRGAFILRHWEQVVARGHRVCVLAPQTVWCRGSIPTRCVIDRFVYAPRALASLTGNFGILENIRDRPVRALLVPPLVVAMARALRRALVERPPDAVIAHMLLPAGWVVAHECTRAGVPFELYGHGTDVDLLLGLPGPLRRRFAAAAGNATAIRFPSAEKRARFAAVFGDVAPLVVEPMVHCVPDDVHAPARSAGPPTVLFLGRLIPQKGVAELLDAAANIRPGPRIEIAGDGPHRARLERRARRLGVDARFHGFVQAAAKHRLLGSADVVCVPSRASGGLSEGAPLVVREAFAYGLPVVATTIGGIPELARPDRTLILVPPDDPQALAGALARVLAESRLHRRRGDFDTPPPARLAGTLG